MSRLIALAASLTSLSALILSGCSSVKDINPLARGDNESRSSDTSATQAAPNLGVNAFLWRASLETLNFMPLDNVDPFGGVIVTEWYANPELPSERFKATVYILDTQLRADALKVSIFKQTGGAGGWRDAAIDADTSREIENAILSRARELFIATN